MDPHGGGGLSAAEQGSVASRGAAATHESKVDPRLHAAVLSGQPHGVQQIFSTTQWSSLNLYNKCLVMMNQPLRMMNRPFKFDIWHSMMMETNSNGMCAIHVAAELGYCDIIGEFLSLMPECVDIRSKDYKTALHVAIEHNQLEVVRRLLQDQKPEKGKKMVSFDHDIKGDTAFHIAAREKVQPEIVKELLRWPGVNPNAMNEEGLTSLDFALHGTRTAGASRNNSIRIKKILQEVGACRSTSMQSQDQEIKTMEVDTLVASLIATITFAVIFQVPGGIEDGKEAQGGKSPVQLGAAKLALDPYFRVFLFCDILALFTSLTVVVAWLFHQQLQIGISVHQSRLHFGKRLQRLSAWSLGISVTCAGIAFLCAAFLVVIPPHLKKIKTTHEKEFGEYKRLHSIMTASVLLPFTISIFAVYLCIFFDFISRRLKNPYPRQFYFHRRVFFLGSVVMSVSVALILQFFWKTTFSKRLWRNS